MQFNNIMRKVLVLTTHFPPSAHVGAKRIAKFCKYLPQYGWQPIVITRKTSQFHLLDETLNDDLPSNIQVYRVGAEGKNKQIANFGGKPKRYNILKTILITIYDFLIFYDYFWIIKAFMQARKIIKDNDIKVVLTTFPNAEPLIVGILLKYFLGIKWVTEFRDPWLLSHHVYNIPASQRLLEKYLEMKIMRKSDHIIVIGEELKKIFSNKDYEKSYNNISVIYNGYDPDDFIDLEKEIKEDRFVVTLLGTWGKQITPEYFLRALGKLLRNNNNIRRQIIVRFIGEVKFDPQLALNIKRIIHEENLQDIISMVPFMPHKKGLAKLKVSDLLLLVTQVPQTETDYNFVIGTKIFEYLYIGKPILALVPPEGEVAQIIKRANAGEIAEPTDLVGIQEKIYALYRQYINGELTIKPDRAYINQFSRVFLTEKLANIFNNLIEIN